MPSDANFIYFDNNATTAVDPRVLDAMAPYWAGAFANPSSPYTPARVASLAVARAREQVAALIGAAPTELVFTSGGTESNHLALHGALALRPGRRRLVVSAVEHASVRETARHWADHGGAVTEVPVDRAGRLDLAQVRAAVRDDAAALSFLAANNETGVCFPLSELAEIAHAAGALFHTDAVQAAGRVSLDVRAVGADLATVCAHKMHGPKGVGALYVRDGLPLPPQLRGGGQEQGRRAGTENVPGVVGFGCAADLAREGLPDMGTRVRALRDRAVAAILEGIPRVDVVGEGADRLPNTVLLLVDRVETEALLARLDLENLCCSSGSACAAGATEPSHVLEAMGLLSASTGVLRISLSRFTTAAEVESLVDGLRRSVKELRASWM